jgi:cytochrome c oxidase subunit 2
MIRRGLMLALAGSLALLPAVAQAQSDSLAVPAADQTKANEVPTAPRMPSGPQASPSPPGQGVAGPPAAAAATTLTPQNDIPGVGPGAPVGTTGEGGTTPAFPHQAPRFDRGQPDGGADLQQQFTPIGVEGRTFSDYVLLPMMAAVTLLVFALLAYCILAFRAKDGRVPSKTSHNTTVEVIWTLAPVLILLGIAVPSFRLLANQYDPPKADLTIKAIGHQWYWSYEYPDHGVSFDSIMLTDQEAQSRGLPRLLETDNRVVVPAGATVKVLVTSEDVIHSWAIPSFWVKMDAVPGRLNETWFKVDEPGVYYGMCSELCGTRHAFMPIAVEVVPAEQFRTWVSMQGGTFPSAGEPPAAEAMAPTSTPSAGDAGAGPATGPVSAEPAEAPKI